MHTQPAPALADSTAERNTLAHHLNRPLTFGGRTVANRIALAPMAGLGHVAFRECLHQFGGCGLMFTEMCNAKALPSENPARSEVFRWHPEELPQLICQIFGSDPAVMAKAGQRIEQEGFLGVDLNFGCSVAAICKQGAGAALLKDPDKAVAVVEAVRNAVSIPVSVKFRTGWADDPAFPVALAKRFEAAGCDLLTFHPRVSPDRRSRPPKWDYIRQVKEAVSIPVFGNGNLFLPEDALKMLEETGCDGLSIGRMAVARPWLFAEWTGRLSRPVSHERVLHDVVDRYCAHFGTVRGIRLFKKYLIYAMANFRFGHKMHAKIRIQDTPETLHAAIREAFSTNPATSTRPNLNLFL